MKKQITVALLALVLVLSLVCVIACDPKPVTYKLTYESGLGGGYDSRNRTVCRGRASNLESG